MADVYTFRVELSEFETLIWREIEITWVSSVAKLAYAILAAFESNADHLFMIIHDNNFYQISYDEDEGFRKKIDPITTKLSALKLSVGEQFQMVYDFGASWEFNIELLSVTEMKCGAGNHYPFLTASKGKGIIDQASPTELAEIIAITDETNQTPITMIYYGEHEVPWDYRDFDLEYSNMFFKDRIWGIINEYE